MSNPVPDQLALTSIADGSPRIAAPIRNNYSSIQTAVNALIVALSGGSSGQVLTATDSADVEWSTGLTRYRKTTAQAVTNTVTETDLLNGEITLAANAMGTSGCMRLTAWGDAVFTNGGSQSAPRFKLKFGSGPTTVIDTGALANAMGSSATRAPWRILVEVVNLGATNSQWVTFSAEVGNLDPNTGSVAFAIGEGHVAQLQGPLPVPAWYLGSNSASIDTTASQLIQLTTTNGSATSTEVKLYAALVEIT